ncbi:hypothetical protein PF003_g23581 [Phytophthora fragariae]|nr:hypothetical protein PF003_g23581 [Phytophthora fragariae]
MRCHRGFWAYAGEVGAEISASAARFAREQAAQDPPGADKAAEDWLRSRAGRTLKDKWLAEADAVRDKYIQYNNDVGFPLDDFPKGIADGSRDRRRYPRMVRADVTTPQIVQEPSALVQAGTSYESQGAVQVESFNTYRRELVRAAFAAEITALAHAVKERQIEEAVNHSAAVVECMGAQIASGLSPAARQRVVGIASDVAGYLRAATTQMMMYTDAEAAAAIDESVARVKSAD